MKQFTFSAQVANNLLTVLQGYSKTIRLLLVMFLTLTVSANAWAADVTLSSSTITSNKKLAYTSEWTYTANNVSWSGYCYTDANNRPWIQLKKDKGVYVKIVTPSGSKITQLKVTITSSTNSSGGIADITKHTDFSGRVALLTEDAAGSTSMTGVAYTTTVSNDIATLNPSGNNNTLYLKVSGGARIWSMTVTYETAAAATYKVTYNANGATSGTAPTDATSYTSGTTVTVKSNSGNLAKTGYTFGGWNTKSDGTGTNYTAGSGTFTITANTTLYAKWNTAIKYTVTLNAGPGTCAASVTETSAGAGVTLPTPTLDCGNWEFAGWATSAVATETSSKPATLLTGTYKPTANTTLYAVYQRTETTQGGGGTQNKTYTHSITSKTWSANGAQTLNSISWTLNNNGSYYGYDGTKGQQVGSSGSPATSMTLTTSGFASATKITAVRISTSGASSINGTVSVKVGSTAYTSGGSTTKSLTTTNTEYEFTGSSTENITISWSQTSSKAIYFKTIEVDYQTTGAGGTIITTYYHSTPDCAAGDPCDALQAPNVTATATANSITLSWEAVDGATSYNVYNYTTDEAEEVNVLTYTFNGLDPETEYEWEVEAVSATCDGKGTTGTTTTSATPCEKLDDATGLTVETDFVHTDGKTYVKFSWTPADNTKANATSQKICFGKVDEAGTCVDDLEKNLTWTGDLKSKLEPGEYWWSIQALGDGVNYCDGDVVNGTNFTIEAPKASITLSELGVTTTDNTTYYVGDQYTLPTTSSQSCDGKQLVGWSTVEVAETDTKPTENYYELGAEVTLAETQTFYAVFAQSNGGGGGNGDYVRVTEALDDWSGDYLIAYNDQTFANGSIGGEEGMGAEGNKQDLSLQINNNTIPANIGDLYNVTLVTVDGGYVLQTKDNKYNYQSSNANGLALTDNIETAKKYPLTVTFNNENDIAIAHNHGAIFHYNKNQAGYFRFYKDGGQQPVYLYKKSGSSATYTAYTTSCIPTYSITYDFAGGTGSHCSNTSVPQGDPYNICDEAPTKEGHTFQGWSDGTDTYEAGETITPTDHVILTAQWQINTYTVTWSNNGAPTPVEYNHGVALVVPEEPESCDGVKEFVGWTEQSGYYHATTAPTDLFKTTTATVIADKTYYAVFATPGAGGTEFVLGESGTFKMYANVDGTNHYAQGGVSSNKLSSTTDILTASDYTLTYADGSYTIKQGTSTIGHSSKTDLTSTASTWTISAGANGSWRITSDKDNSRALSYNTEANAFKAYATSNLTAGNETYFDIEFGSGSDAHSDYTTICQTVESIEIADYTTEFFVTDEFAFGGTVTAHFDGGGTQDVTALAHFSGYNMNVTGTYTVTVTYMGATATYEINVKPLDNAWVLTWNVSGKTNTGLGPRSVTKGSAIGTLPTPIVPDACEGKTFMGWTESNVVNSDGSGITYITKDTKPTDNTTYYAVFATVNNFCTQKPINQIASGSKVVIVAVASLTDDGGAGKAISSRVTDDTYNLQGDDVAIYDQTINTPHNTCIWTITKEGEKYVFTQEEGKYLNGAKVDSHYNLKYNDTKDTWSLTSVAGKENTYRMQSTNTAYFAEFYTGKFTLYKEANDQGEFDMQFFVTANANGEADITDYTTGCAEYTITYYGFQGGYSTSCSSDGTIVLPVNSLHTIPNCGDVVKDHTNLNRTFTGVWMTQPHGGHTFKPGDTFILTQDTTLYAQWELNTQNDFTTLPTDVEDLAGTDIYVYGGKTLTLQPGTTTINSLTLKGGIQTDGSYQMPSVWVPEGATLVRNSNKIYLDLVVNAENWYPFAVPFETKNTSDIHYLHPDMKSAAKYSKHFDIKTYDGARRADVGEDKANNWVRLKRHTAEEPVSFKPGVGYIISAMAYPGTDTATIRIPMTVPNTWFKNGEQAVVGTTVRNTIAVTAHTGEAATEHQRHAGWNFVANPYLSNFTGGGIDATNGLDYIDGELIIQGSYEYSEETVPYVTIPAYNFAYYSQHKLSDVKLSPEWSFFVQVGTSGTMDFTTTGRQQAPASIAARAEERPVKMDVDITLSDNHSSDQTGIIISDRYNDTYEIGRDLEKLFGSAYNLSVYTLMADNTPLAFQALAIRSNMQVIPVGYRAPEQGEYTFRLNEATSSIDLLNEQYEQLILVDYQTGELTNLLISDYTFYSERTQADNRFAIYAVPRQNAPTDLPNAIGQDKEAQKIIHNGHLYILRDGNVYNGNGQIVK